MMMNMAPSSASRLSFYNQEQKEEVTPDVNKNTPSSASNTTLSLLTGIALSLASPVSDDTKDDDDDDDDGDNDVRYCLFLSVSLAYCTSDNGDCSSKYCLCESISACTIYTCACIRNPGGE
mmetsp:Transcript_42703/g.47733  ORF Transcript_42703/g.47733 Transcript_42703/m.47733 type:complete len:121 (+) Transcript_42703:587-949(+)